MRILDSLDLICFRKTVSSMADRSHFQCDSKAEYDQAPFLVPNERIVTSLEKKECHKNATRCIVGDHTVQKMFSENLGGLNIENTIPIKQLTNQIKEQTTLSGILSELVQTGLRNEVDRLNQNLLEAYQVCVRVQQFE